MKKLFALLIAFGIGLSSGLFATAQDSTTAPSLLEGLGLPEIEVTITADGVTAPTEYVGGPALLIVNNQTDGYTVTAISQLPDGVSDEDYLDVLMNSSFPDWVADVDAAGGIDLPPQLTGMAVVNLSEGEWVIGVAGDEPIANPIARLVATGSGPDGLAESIPVDYEVELGAYVFGLPDQIEAGPAIWHLFNTHAVMHHIVLFKADRLFSVEEVEASIMSEMMGTPVPDGFSLTTAEFIYGSAGITEGQETWLEIDLEPGAYVALCFLPDPGGDMPHAMMGMIDTFEVAG